MILNENDSYYSVATHQATAGVREREREGKRKRVPVEEEEEEEEEASVVPKRTMQRGNTVEPAMAFSF
jgi:hypothetical protein